MLSISHEDPNDQAKKRGSRMYSIEIHLQSHHDYSEVLPQDMETIELLVEDLVSRVLLELFGQVTVEAVIIHRLPLEQASSEERNTNWA